MDEQNSVKNIAKGALKAFIKKLLIPTIIVVIIIVMLLTSTYTIFKNDFESVSNKNSNYSLGVNSSGQITYTTTDPNGGEEPVDVTPEQMAEEFKNILGDYIDGDDEYYQKVISYLIGAEAVTKMPYIDPIEEAKEPVDDVNGEEPTEGETDSTELQGQIKFYRYSSEDEANDAYNLVKDLKEKYRLKYVSQGVFENEKEAFLEGKETSLFDHFTLDDEGNVIIAYSIVETRTIETKDKEITYDIVKDSSTAPYEETSDGFEATIRQVYETKIDYLSLVEQYIMPTNLLYALLIQTRDIKFVEAFAGMAYENEIAIGIYDNTSYTKTTEKYTYNKIVDIEGETTLKWGDFNIDPNSIITDEKLANYSFIKSCTTTIENGECDHVKHYNSGTKSGGGSVDYNNVYVKSVNGDGQITELGTEEQAKDFKTTFIKEIDATATPTVGVMLADTWIATWKATYKKDDVKDVDSSDKGEKDEVSILATYESENFLNAFGSSMKVDKKLQSHAENLRDTAVQKIIDDTVFDVPARTNFSQSELMEQWYQHIRRLYCLFWVNYNKLYWF